MKEYKIMFINEKIITVNAADVNYYESTEEYHFFDSTDIWTQKIITRCPARNVLFVTEII